MGQLKGKNKSGDKSYLWRIELKEAVKIYTEQQDDAAMASQAYEEAVDADKAYMKEIAAEKKKNKEQADAEEPEVVVNAQKQKPRSQRTKAKQKKQAKQSNNRKKGVLAESYVSASVPSSSTPQRTDLSSGLEKMRLSKPRPVGTCSSTRQLSFFSVVTAANKQTLDIP